MVYGTSNGIASLYKVCEEKGVRVDKGNKGADFATKQQVLNSNAKRIPTDPKKVSQATFSAEGIKRNQEYLNSFSELPEKYAKSAPNDGKDKCAIRRKCKSILYWQLIIKGLRVQFVVSGLDLEKVPQKMIVSDRKWTGRLSSVESNKEEGITDAELRWVFRNRNVELVQKGVQFWKTSNEDRYGKPTPCEAPWDMPAYQAAWKEYGLRVEKKRSDGIDQTTGEPFSTVGKIRQALAFEKRFPMRTLFSPYSKPAFSSSFAAEPDLPDGLFPDLD
jgi:hypothetical protein